MTRLAVLGSPIAHSRSPLLHAAAYAVLGVDWAYERVELSGDELPVFLEGLDADWRGLSLTMPLKRDVLPLLTTIDEVAELTGAANTVLLDGDGRHGFNTDVAGIVRAFERSGVSSLDTVQILGAGATAASAVAAVRSLGATRVLVSARSPERAAPLVGLGARLGIDVSVGVLGNEERVHDAVIDTLPGGAAPDLQFPKEVRRRSVLFAVAYDPWPSPLTSAWLDADGVVVDGLDMLVEQALVQVRIFVEGDPASELDDEEVVLAAMRQAVTR